MRRPGLVRFAAVFLAAAVCAMPAMACDEGQKWGFSPDAISRATSMISDGRYASNVSKGICAIRLHQRLNTFKPGTTCEQCRSPYRGFLRVLIASLKKAISSASQGQERDYFKGYHRRVEVEMDQFDGMPSLEYAKMLTEKSTVDALAVMRDPDQTESPRGSNARLLDEMSAIVKDDE